MAAADDMSIEKLKKDMDDSIWNNPKIFSTEKPWYYYVNAFRVKDSVTKNQLEKIKSICVVNEQITILNCEPGLRKLVQVGARLRVLACACACLRMLAHACACLQHVGERCGKA